MMEYEGNSKETKTTIRDGFIYTGDIGVIDSKGFLSITDRKKDVIFVKGFRIGLTRGSGGLAAIGS